MTVGTLHLPERSAIGSGDAREVVCRIGSGSGTLALAKAHRTHARHLVAKLGPFTVPTAIVLQRPVVLAVVIGLPTPVRTSRAFTTTRSARGPPAPLPV